MTGFAHGIMVTQMAGNLVGRAKFLDLAPVIFLVSGTGHVGSVYGSSKAGQWFADGVAIPGATGETYTRTRQTEAAALSPAGSNVIPRSVLSIDLFAAGEWGFLLDPSAPGALFQTTALAVPAATGDPVGYAADQSGRGNHLTQTVAADRPLLEVTGGRSALVLNGVNQRMNVALPNRTANMYLAGCVSTLSSSNGTLFGNTALNGYFLLRYQADNDINSYNLAGFPTTWVDGVQIGPRRTDLYAALQDGLPHVVEVTGADLTDAGWSNAIVGSVQTTGFFSGRIYGLMLTSHVPDAATRAAVRAAFASRGGIGS